MRRFNVSIIAGFVGALMLMPSCTPDDQIGSPADMDHIKSLVRTTSWGQSDDVRNNLTFNNNPNPETVGVPSRKLTNVLTSIFPSGVYKIFAFDEKTPGFFLGNMTLLVAVGGDTVALIVSGAGTAGCVTPTTLFTDTGDFPNVFVFKGGDLAAVGPLTYAEVTHNAGDGTRGYIYVGGCNGMARLQQVGSNDGWNNNDGLYTNYFNSTINEFKRLPQFDGLNVVALQSRDADLVVLTTEELLYAPSNMDIVDTTIARRRSAHYGTDLVMTEDWVIFATTGGVFWTNRLLTATPQLLGGVPDTPVALDYLSLTKGYRSSTGNLIVMTEDRDNDRGRAYRFFVDDTGIRSIKGGELIVDWTQFRRDVSTDGLIFFSSRIASSDQSDLLEMFTRDGGINSLTNALNVPEATKYAGRPVRDPASGSWVVPGQSARVNE